jgi:TIR domain-containing protein
VRGGVVGRPAASRERASVVQSTTARGRIFISYRREETAYPAGWLFDRLSDHFGQGQVFKDIDSIEPGDDFVDVLTNAVGACDVLLALIGTEWLTVTNDEGRRRIDNPADFVRLEIEAALSRNVRVVPVLVDGAKMPGSEDLPPSLAPLTRRHAIELSPSHFDFETTRLVRVLDETLGNGRSGPMPDDEAPPQVERSARLLHSSRARILGGVGAAAAVAAVVTLLLVALKPGGPSGRKAIFSDDFSSPASGWDDAGGSRNGGHYTNGAYRLYTRWTPDHFSDAGLPRNAASVFPSAPRDVRIDVVARLLLGGDQDAGYGIACRSAASISSYYQFSIWSDHFEIAKITPTAPFFQALRQSEDLSAASPNGENRLQAVCSTDDAGASRLVFSVNGQVVASATDADSPLTAGTVGLVVASDNAKAIEAEFDDFVVSPA